MLYHMEDSKRPPQLACRVPDEWVAALDRAVEKRRARDPQACRSDILREALRERLEREGGLAA